jgi:surface protein
MKAQLKENEDKEMEGEYENFETDEPKSNKKKPKRHFTTIFSILFLVILIIVLFYYIGIENTSSNLSEEYAYKMTTKCRTTDLDKLECKTCEPSDKLKDGKCLLNHSFKAVYHTDEDNEKVTLFTIPDEAITEMFIDDKKVDPVLSYTFPTAGDHAVYALINMKRCFTLGGMFNGNKNLISIEFTPLFDTSKVNEMNFMFQNCEKLTSIDVSNLNTQNVAFMEYMFSGCSSLKTLDVRNFNTENVEKMNSVFQGCSSL